MEIKVLGTGCAKCNDLESVVREAVKESGVEANVQKITDIQDIAKAGVMMTPALMINEEVKISGKVPTREEVIEHLKAE